MKKRFLIALLLLVLLFTGVRTFAQGLGNNYVRVQYLSPFGQYTDFYSQGMGAEYGHSFYFDLVIGDLVCPGIDVTFVEVGFTPGKTYDYSVAYPQIPDNKYITEGGFLATIGPKVGLIGSLELIDGLFFETSAKYCPTLIFGRRTLGETPTTLKDVPGNAFNFANRFSVNLELKYRWFSFGGEFMFGKVNLTYSDKVIPDLDNNLIPSDIIELGLNTFKLYVGFNF
jgi:hypothetical protein